MWIQNSLWTYMGIFVSELMKLKPKNLYLNNHLTIITKGNNNNNNNNNNNKTKERNKPQIIVQPALHPNPRFHVYILSLSLWDPNESKKTEEKKKEADKHSQIIDSNPPPCPCINTTR